MVELVFQRFEPGGDSRVSIRHDTIGTTVHAAKTQGFDSPALQTLRTRLAECDPFKSEA